MNTHSHVIFDTNAETIQGGNDKSFQQEVLRHLHIHEHKDEAGPLSDATHKTNSDSKASNSSKKTRGKSFATSKAPVTKATTDKLDLVKI